MAQEQNMRVLNSAFYIYNTAQETADFVVV